MGVTCNYTELVESMGKLRLNTRDQEYRLRAVIILSAFGKIDSSDLTQLFRELMKSYRRDLDSASKHALGQNMPLKQLR